MADFLDDRRKGQFVNLLFMLFGTVCGNALMTVSGLPDRVASMIVGDRCDNAAASGPVVLEAANVQVQQHGGNVDGTQNLPSRLGCQK